MRHRKLLSVAVATCALWGFAAQGASAQESEVTGLLRELVRINTSNPPGNEAAVAELLRAKLEPLGFQIDVIQTPTPNKAHFIARLKAAQPTEKPLLLAGHEDTVGVEAPLWTVDPFGAVVKNGFVYGRGTMDFKGGLAAFTVAAMRLARSGVALKRDVILLAEADEEGGDYGTGWLAENHWDKIDAGVSLNEGGWIFKGAGGKPKLMGITTIDKDSLSVTLATRGTSTHSSRPLPDSAIRRLVRALRRIDGHETDVTLTPTARRYLKTWRTAFGGSTGRTIGKLLAAKREKPQRRYARALKNARYGELFNGLARNIFVPTIVESGFRANVLPGTAEATVNLRMLPGQRPRPLLRELARAIADPKVKITPITTGGRTVEEQLDSFDERAKQKPSNTGTDLYAALQRESLKQWPGVRVTPALFEAGTDAVPWRAKGIPVYGVYPYPIGLAELQAMHGNDERIALASLEQGTDMLTRVVQSVAAR